MERFAGFVCAFLLIILFPSALCKPLSPISIAQLINATKIWNQYIKIWKAQHASVPDDAFGQKNFTCHAVATKLEEPKNVHMLSPKFVGVVGALGDSLSAANGAGADSLPGVALQYRGYSFSIGGEETLEKATTLPNAIRKYNPTVYGAAKKTTTSVYQQLLSQLDVAVPGARARDMPDQANMLVRRINERKSIKNQWKVVTIFIGANDLCGCDKHADMDKAVAGWIADITKAMNILAKGLTKTFVNIVNAVFVAGLRPYDSEYVGCSLLHNIECPCVALGSDRFNETIELTRKYQAAIRTIPDKYEYTDRSDFTIVVQPCSENILVPMRPEDSSSAAMIPDLSYLAPDCFHFGRRSHAAAAASLWNNMLQPAGAKQNFIDPTQNTMQCPDAECPYFRTAANSVNCSMTYLSAL